MEIIKDITQYPIYAIYVVFSSKNKKGESFVTLHDIIHNISYNYRNRKYIF